MNDHNEPLNELPDGLRGIVDGIHADSVPSDLKESLRSRLEDGLRPRPPKRRVRRYTTVAIATSLIAASVVIILLTRPAPTDSVVSNDATNQVTDIPDHSDVAPVSRESTAGPSLWAYHRAANDSLDHFDGLLNEHAALVLTPGQSTTRQPNPRTHKSFLEEL